MLRRVIAGLVVTLAGALLLTGSSFARQGAAKPGPPFSGITLMEHSISWLPGEHAFRNQPGTYDISWINHRSGKIRLIKVDLKFAKQRLQHLCSDCSMRNGIVVKLAPGSAVQKLRITGSNHIVFYVTNVPPDNGFGILANVRVLKTASGSFCNKFLLTLNGKVADYSNVFGTKNPCTPIRTPAG